MSKVEDKALKLYPMIGSYDNLMKREGFIEGYHQAEKDLALSWKDIADILDVTDVIANDYSMEERLKTMSEEEYCQEVLKRFLEIKH